MTTRTGSRVLLVDGEELLLQVDRTFLRRPELKIVPVGPGEDAVAAAAALGPDLAIFDVRASSPRAFEDCRRLKDDPSLRDVPVLLLATRFTIAAAREAGADAVVFKPLVLRELLDAVRELLALRDRSEDRLPSALRVAVGWRGVEIATTLQDLSASGVGVRSHRIPAVGDEVTLRFRLPGEEEDVACTGIVRSRRESSDGVAAGFGVEFEDLGAAERSRLAGFVRSALARPFELP